MQHGLMCLQCLVKCESYSQICIIRAFLILIFWLQLRHSYISFFIFIIFVQNVKCSHTASVMVFRPACYISSCSLLKHIQYITHITRWHRHVGSSCAARAYCCKNTFIFKPSVYFIKRRSNVGNDMSMSQQNLKSCLNILDLCLSVIYRFTVLYS